MNNDERDELIIETHATVKMMHKKCDTHETQIHKNSDNIAKITGGLIVVSVVITLVATLLG